MLAEKDSERAKAWTAGKPELAEGIYLVRVFVDGEGWLAKDWKAALGDADFVGETEFRARWNEGYGAMTTVEATRVKK